MINLYKYIKGCFFEQADLSDEDIFSIISYMEKNGYFLDPQNIIKPGKNLCIFFNKSGERLIIALDGEDNICMFEKTKDSQFEISKTNLSRKERYEYITGENGKESLVVGQYNSGMILYFNSDSYEFIKKANEDTTAFTKRSFNYSFVPPYIDPDDFKKFETDTSLLKMLEIKAYAQRIRETAKTLMTDKKQL